MPATPDNRPSLLQELRGYLRGACDQRRVKRQAKDGLPVEIRRGKQTLVRGRLVNYGGSSAVYSQDGRVHLPNNWPKRAAVWRKTPQGPRRIGTDFFPNPEDRIYPTRS